MDEYASLSELTGMCTAALDEWWGQVSEMDLSDGNIAHDLLEMVFHISDHSAESASAVQDMLERMLRMVENYRSFDGWT